MRYFNHWPSRLSASKKSEFYIPANRQERHLPLRGLRLGVVTKVIDPSHCGLFTSPTPENFLKTWVEPHILAQGPTDEGDLSWVNNSLAAVFFGFLEHEFGDPKSLVQSF
jgi:hypothetical protein